MLEFFLGVVVGAGLLYIGITWAIRQLIAKFIAEDRITTDANLVIRAHVEQLNGVFYFYNKDSGEFLVQGRDLQELLDHSESRWPGATVQVVDGDKETIANLKAMTK
jgi:hypothetical protein